MRHFTSVVLFAGLSTFVLAAPAAAQSRPGPPRPAPKQPRLTLLINGGYQPSTTSFDDEFSVPLYQEQQTTEVSYPVDAGPLFEGGAAIRLWKGLAVGGVISKFAVEGTANVTSSVPHPLLLLHNREVTGEPGDLRREETAVHIQAQYQLPPFGKLQVVLAGGPSIIDIKQAIVTNVRYTETYPYDTATFAGVDSRRVSGTASGFNAGVDFQWMFNRNVGAGALVRVTKATVDLSIEGRTIQVDAGGTQIGVGLRLAF
jgi:hypothetical protein